MHLYWIERYMIQSWSQFWELFFDLLNYFDKYQEDFIEKEEKMVYVDISDTGKAISPKIMPHLFEKFVTDPDFGTGLGLFITRKLVEAHGGRIWAFNNNDGIGSTFMLSLPK